MSMKIGGTVFKFEVIDPEIIERLTSVATEQPDKDRTLLKGRLQQATVLSYSDAMESDDLLGEPSSAESFMNMLRDKIRVLEANQEIDKLKELQRDFIAFIEELMSHRNKNCLTIITIGKISYLFDFSHPDLQGKRALVASDILEIISKML